MKTPVAMFFITCLLLVSPALAQRERQLVQENTAASAVRRIALVIGNATYTNAPQLRNPVNDASDMAVALSEVGFEVEHGNNLTQRQMKAMIREFGKKLRGGGQGLFYYAGHGVQLRGRNYLIPVDADIQSEADVEDQGVDANLVLNLMDEAGNGLNVLILDACRNNPFARSFRDATNGLAQMDAPSGTIIAYATAPGSVASDGDARNGIYTQELLKLVRIPNLGIEEVFKQVRISVRNLTRGRQTPWESSSLTGNYYFAVANSGNRPAKSSSNSSSGIDVEANYWARIEKSNRAEDFTAYLREYPGGRYAPLARQRISELTGSTSTTGNSPSSGSTLEDPQKYYAISLSNFNKGNFDRALVEINRAIELSPGYAQAYVVRAGIYHVKNNHDAAIADCTKAISLNLQNEAPYLIRGSSYNVKGNFDEGMADFNKAIQINPQVGAAYSGRGVSYFGKGDYDRAIEEFTKSIRLSPNDMQTYYNRGNAYFNKKDYDRAIADFTKAIELNPQLAVAYGNRAIVYEKKGDMVKAEADRRRYRELMGIR